MASENTLYSAQVCYFIGRLGSLLENSEIHQSGFFWFRGLKNVQVLQKLQALHKMSHKAF